MRLVLLALLVTACHPPGYGKGDDKEPAIDAPPSPDAAIDTPAATTCEKNFRLEGMGGAQTVWLTGSFTAWGGNPGAGAVEMTKDAGSVWNVTRTMDSGEAQYKFIVDTSNWISVHWKSELRRRRLRWTQQRLHVQPVGLTLDGDVDARTGGPQRRSASRRCRLRCSHLLRRRPRRRACRRLRHHPRR